MIRAIGRGRSFRGSRRRRRSIGIVLPVRRRSSGLIAPERFLDNAHCAFCAAFKRRVPTRIVSRRSSGVGATPHCEFRCKSTTRVILSAPNPRRIPRPGFLLQALELFLAAGGRINHRTDAVDLHNRARKRAGVYEVTRRGGTHRNFNARELAV